MSYIKEKGLLNSANVVIKLPFIEEIMVYPNTSKLKPLPIDPYNRTKDLVDYVQTFQSYMHYVDAHDAIMFVLS